MFPKQGSSLEQNTFASQLPKFSYEKNISSFAYETLGFLGGSVIKNLPANAGDVRSIPGLGRSLEEEIATHSSILAWEFPWTEKPGEWWSMGQLEIQTQLWD